MQFLDVPEYRPAVLSGLLISIGSKTDSTVIPRSPVWAYIRSADYDICQQRHVRNSLVTYAKKLPGDGNGGGDYTLQGLVADLVARAKSNLSSNTNVIPVLQALNALLEADALERLCYSEEGLKRLDERSVRH